MKSSHKVTILGQTSGGGACIVLPLSLADGTLLQVASNRELSYIKNGVLADVDSGDIAKGENVLFWHTGGATALFAEPEILGRIV